MAIFPQSDKMLALIARRFRTLGEPFRLRLLQVLETGEKTVGDLVALTEGTQPNVSKHLQILHHAGIVSRRREGTSIFYSIGDPMVLRICELVCRDAVEHARERLQELNDELSAAGVRRRRGQRP
jgi:DNA-binding transcriptional ArsR family regulator